MKLKPSVAAVAIFFAVAAGTYVGWGSGGATGPSSTAAAPHGGHLAARKGRANNDRAPGALASPPAGTAMQVHTGPGWPANRTLLKGHTLLMESVEKTLLGHAFKPTGKKYDGKNEWLGFQIKEIDWVLEPFARAHHDVQEAVYGNCSFQSIKNGQMAHSGSDEPTWDCPPGAFPCPHCTPPDASEPAAFSHVHMGDIKWYGMDGLDLFIYLAFFASPERAPGGRFLEVGNYDGLDNSNTVFFENTLGWTGVLFEPTTCADKYASNRKARTVKGALCATPGHYMSGRYADCGAANVTCQPLLGWSPETEYDFMSIDVEGAELNILEAIDFSRIKVKVLLVEWRPHNRFERRAYLKLYGFTCIFINGYKAKPSDVQWGGDELCWNSGAGVTPDHRVANAVLSKLSR